MTCGQESYRSYRLGVIWVWIVAVGSCSPFSVSSQPLMFVSAGVRPVRDDILYGCARLQARHGCCTQQSKATTRDLAMIIAARLSVRGHVLCMLRFQIVCARWDQARPGMRRLALASTRKPGALVVACASRLVALRLSSSCAVPFAGHVCRCICSIGGSEDAVSIVMASRVREDVARSTEALRCEGRSRGAFGAPRCALRASCVQR